MVTKVKNQKKTTAKTLKGLVQMSLIPAQTEVERMVDYFKQDMNFKDIRITVNIETEGSRQCYGHFTEKEVYKSTIDNKGSYELKISSEHLDRTALEIATTVRHELVHAKNTELKVRDTSNQGIYHNGKFLDMAVKYGLEMHEKTKQNGYGLTKGFNPIYEAIVLQELKPDDNAFTLVRIATEKKRKEKSPTKMRKWTCECGNNVRYAGEDLDSTHNTCGTAYTLADTTK